jgi:tetrahydromethanopterin S-methyltransferase subunit B
MNMSDKSIDKLDEEEIALDETLALDSVKTKGKAADMNAVMQLMQAMPEADFNKFVETMNQFAAGKDYGVGDNAMHNATTIMAKEDLDVIFNDSDELSEEFKEKTSTLFEAALGARIAVETSALEEKYESKLQENMDHLVESLQSNIDTYMDYVVENWMEANRPSSPKIILMFLRTELMSLKL